MKKILSFLFGAATTYAVLAIIKKKKQAVDICTEEETACTEDGGDNTSYTETDDIAPSLNEKEPVDYTKDYVVEGIDETETTRLKPDIIDIVNIFDEKEQEIDKEEEDRFYVVTENEPKEPHLILPFEFGGEEDGFGYLTDQLTYYSSGRLCDRYGKTIENPVEMIGQEALSKLINCTSVYDDDAVLWVRNDKYRTDYEVSWDTEN